jgi:hypothetical protein
MDRQEFSFHDKNGHKILDLTSANPDDIAKVIMTWDIQKNCQNNEKITILADPWNLVLFPVRAVLHMVLQARRLGQAPTMPLACYRLRADQLFLYLMGKRIAFLFRQACKVCLPACDPPVPALFRPFPVGMGLCPI